MNESAKVVLDRVIKFYEGIKGEPPLKSQKAFCLNCLPTTPSLMKSKAEQFTGSENRYCVYQGRREDELPDFFQRRAPAD